jgi:hypothetical protein
MYFIYLNENRTMKPVEIILSREWEGMSENDGGGKPTKEYCVYGNVTMNPTLYN